MREAHIPYAPPYYFSRTATSSSSGPLPGTICTQAGGGKRSGRGTGVSELRIAPLAALAPSSRPPRTRHTLFPFSKICSSLLVRRPSGVCSLRDVAGEWREG